MPLRRVIRRAIRLLELERRGAARARPVLPHTVLYESFAGNGALDNPEALFRELLRDPRFADFRHVWSLDAASGHDLRAEFARHPRVRFVRPRSSAYLEALARSQYLITNATFPPEFQKRPGQTVVNSWHGTPLKRMGYDMPDGAYEAANTLRNFLSSDVLLSQNPHMTRMYREAYRLDGLFRGRILELGYPRTDRQHPDVDGRDEAIDRLRAAGIDPGDRRVVVYAPTWKGTSFSSPRDDAAQLLDTTTRLQDLLGPRYLVVLKAHQAVHAAVAGHRGDAPLISNDVPTNLLLGVAHALVTDYSSIFIDFLGTGRRIVFFTPDRSDYARDRGTYFADDELPGPVVRTLEEVADALLTRTAGRTEIASRWRDGFTAQDDGGAAARVIDAVFGSTAREPERVSPRRPTVLLYLGGMRSNGITTSALNLLAHLDHDSLDVSVVIARPRTREQRANAARIDPRVRQFHRMGGLTGRASTQLIMRVLGRARPTHREAGWETRLWHDEWTRTVGDARFDTVIDFSGYSRFWTELVLHSPPARRLIWLHNDMVAEIDRPVGRRRRMRRTLPAVFALHPGFDGLVSVSSTLSAANADGLAERYGIPRERFLVARNMIDAGAVLARRDEPLEASTDATAGASAVDSGSADAGDDPAPWIDRLLVEHDDPDIRWFVTVGRLSPEKNHARLLDAFARVHREHPSTRLLLIGDGPLRRALERRRDELGLGDAVVLTGALANPFPAMVRADCFVLSSDYEGQPMVLLEAAVAGLPIVSVRFGSVADALPGDRLHVVDQTVDALAQGLRDYLEGRVLASVFDAEEYNALARREFEAAIDPRAADRVGPDSSPSSSAVLSARAISASSAIPARSSTATTAATAATMTNVQPMSASSAGEPPRHP